MSEHCKHRHTWLIAGGYWEWCYECGAIRGMHVGMPNSVWPRTCWERPVGVGGKNPAMWRKCLRELPKRKGRTE